jgi:GntR family transcriptional regulator, transcriptional repressor for pyruvate dehydrogenase complex
VSTSVSPISTSEAVASHIRDRIHVGEYAPGDRLPPQRELAALLGVSRVSVREGLKLLVGDGYINIRRGSAGGAFVTELAQPAEAWRRRLRNQRSELDDLVEFRIAVESRVAHLAALRSTRSDLTGMRAAMREMRAIADETTGHHAFRLTDAEFHSALGRAARNGRLNRAVEDARSEMFIPYDMLSFDEPRAAVLADHQAIYEAVRDGVPTRAAHLMAEHIQRTREQLLSFVAESPLDA